MKKPSPRNQKNTPPTILTVANHAQVAASTVSLYLNNPERVSAKKSEKIQQAIQFLEYTPNRSAGSLAAKNNRIIAVLVPSVSNSFFALAVKSMQETCEKHNYSMLLGITDHNEHREIDLLRTLMQWSPTGIVLTGKNHHPRVFDMLKKSQAVVGQLWEIGGTKIKLQVGIDHIHVGEVLAEHLIQVNAQHPLYLGIRMNSDWRSNSRHQGAKKCFALHGTELNILEMSPDLSMIENGDLLISYLKKNPETDALISSNDELALAASLALQRNHYKIPNNIKIVSFGDLSFSGAITPPLTTITFPKSKIGTLMIEHLISRIQNPDDTFLRINTGFDLIARKSSSSSL